MGEATVSRTRHFVIICAFAGLLVAASPAQAREVQGHWVNAAPAILTEYHPMNGEFTALGSSVWQGSFDGVTTFKATGNLDLLTGDIDGTIKEKFTGLSRYGDRGSLRFAETLKVRGTHLRIVAHVVDGSGDFAGSRGRIVFKGINAPDGQAAGRYFGRWRPG